MGPSWRVRGVGSSAVGHKSQVATPDHPTTVEDVHLVERGQLVEPVGDVEEARVGGGHQDVVDQPWFVQSRGRLVEDEH